MEGKQRESLRCLQSLYRYLSTSSSSLAVAPHPSPTYYFFPLPPFLAAGFICLAYTRTNRLGGLVLLRLAAGRLELRDGDLPPPLLAPLPPLREKRQSDSEKG